MYASKYLHVHRHVGDALAAVHQHLGADGVRRGGDLADGVHPAQGVRRVHLPPVRGASEHEFGKVEIVGWVKQGGGGRDLSAAAAAQAPTEGEGGVGGGQTHDPIITVMASYVVLPRSTLVCTKRGGMQMVSLYRREKA